MIQLRPAWSFSIKSLNCYHPDKSMPELFSREPNLTRISVDRQMNKIPPFDSAQSVKMCKNYILTIGRLKRAFQSVCLPNREMQMNFAFVFDLKESYCIISSDFGYFEFLLFLFFVSKFLKQSIPNLRDVE